MLKPIKLALALVAVALTGCTAINNASYNADRAAETATRVYRESIPSPADKPRTPRVTVSQGVWLGNQSVALADEYRLPPVFREPTTFKRQVSGLPELSERVTQMTGVPVRAERDVLALNVAGQPTTFDYHGPLTGFLDTVASRYGASWRFRDGAVELFLYETRVFSVRSVPGDSTNDAIVAVSSGASGSTGSSGSSSTGSGSATSNVNNSQNTQMTSKQSVWKSIEDTVKAMLSDKGRAVVSQPTGTVTVTDTPTVLGRVGTFIDKQNRFLSRQVSFQVNIYSVALREGDEYGLDWKLAYMSINGNAGFNMANVTPFQGTGPTNLLTSILNTATGRLAQFAGTELLVKALSEQGKVTRLTSATLTTLNNKPVPLHVGRDTAYLAKVSTTTTADVGATQSLEPGTVNSGYSMNLLPYLAEDGMVYLQFSLDIRDLLQISEVSSGGNRIQTPEVARRSFLQQVVLRSGETLVLSGFEQSNNTVVNRGAFTPQNILLGGVQNGSGQREVLVVTVSPVVAQGV